MDKYGSGKSMEPFKAESFKNIYIAPVIAVGKLRMSDKELSENFNPEDIDKIKKSLERFNADEHSIKVALNGSKLDGNKEDYEYSKKDTAVLPNCFPLTPKHINLVPKIGELVLVIVQSSSERFNDRFYIGPIISSLTKLDKDIDTTSLSNFSDGITDPTEEISKVPLARGIYENPQNLVIEGRNNTDIIQRDEEILLRSGKFITGNPLQFNSVNPGFIQIKSNFNIKIENSDQVKKVTVTNIVSDKINLLTYNGSPNLSAENGLTNVDKKTNVAEYINDDKLEEILNDAHPLVFGDTLVAYLKLIRTALLNHVHNGNGNIACDISPSIALKDFTDKAEKLENAMLSKNIRIN